MYMQDKKEVDLSYWYEICVVLEGKTHNQFMYSQWQFTMRDIKIFLVKARLDIRTRHHTQKDK